MKKKLCEICGNYASLAVLALIGVPIGAAVGVLDTLLGGGIAAATALRERCSVFFLACLPLAGLLLVYVFRRFGGAASRGMSLVFDVANGREEKIPLRMIPMMLGATWLVHLFGGSAGKEGVAMQLGATLSNWAGRRLPICRDRTIFLLTGMAAGFGGLFGTPVAGAFFAMELIAAGRLQYQAVIPACTASFSAFLVSGALGLSKFQFAVAAPPLTAVMIAKAVLLGVLFGMAGELFAYLLGFARRYAAARIENPYARIALLGGIVSVCFLFFTGQRYAGAGTALIEASFTGGTVYGYDWLLKIIFTVLTVAAGFFGGEVTPLCAIGASCGAALGPVFGLPADFAAGLGLAAVFGSGTNTLLAPIFLGAALCGYENLPFFMIACTVAYAFNRNHTIYPWQRREEAPLVLRGMGR